eukprot:451660-Pyramimonas_sp.AAC.1
MWSLNEKWLALGSAMLCRGLLDHWRAGAAARRHAGPPCSAHLAVRLAPRWARDLPDKNTDRGGASL